MLILYLEQKGTLRSGSTDELDMPRTICKTTSIGDSSFSVAAAHAWNSLPTSVTSVPSLSAFKQRLKTELFPRSHGGAQSLLNQRTPSSNITLPKHLKLWQLCSFITKNCRSSKLTIGCCCWWWWWWWYAASSNPLYIWPVLTLIPIFQGHPFSETTINGVLWPNGQR